LVLVSAAILFLALSGGGSEGPEPPRSSSAEAFVDSVGVNVHFSYVDTAYRRQAEVLALLRSLGVRHVRDGAVPGSPDLVQGLRGAAEMGIRSTLIVGEPGQIGVPVRGAVEGMARSLGTGAIAAFEGPNELDISGLPDWEARLQATLAQLKPAVESLPGAVPVVGPSFVDPLNYRQVDEESYDLANLHPYAGGNPPEEALEDGLDTGRFAGATDRFVLTEVGYHNAIAAESGQPPVPERAAAVYLPRTLLWAFREGVPRTFIYELVDEKPDPGRVDPEQHFGLVRQDLSRKPAFDAVRNLIAGVSASPAAASEPAGLPTIRAPDGIERVVLRRGDGSHVVCLWRPVSVWDIERRAAIAPDAVPVELSFNRPAASLTVRRPSVGAEPVRRVRSAERLRVSVAGDVVLISYR